jgi:hypothetical protein
MHSFDEEIISPTDIYYSSQDPPQDAISPWLMADGSNRNNNPLLSTGDEENDTTVHVLSVPTPCQDPDPGLADSLIARDMAASSRKDLERAYYDVHGISEDMEETPAFIERSLDDFDREIRCHPDNQAFQKAESMNWDYVQNPEFRLMFIRADRFDVKSAALRFVRHFQVKLDLFGEEKLAMDITQDDLDRDSMEAVYSGLAQLLPEPDRGGRAVLLWNANGAQYSLTQLAKVSAISSRSLCYLPVIRYDSHLHLPLSITIAP